MNDSVVIGELTWPDYARRVMTGCPIFLPVGALEQHGHHMCMEVDVLLPSAICKAVAQNVDGLVLPALAYGYKSQQKSGGGNHFPGTTSLDGATLTHTVQDIIRELARHGARRLVMMNGHYENSMFIVEGIDLALRELRYGGVNDFKVVVLSYWDFVNDPAVIEKLYPDGFLGWDIEHGGVFETSLMLALHPDKVDLSRAVDHPPLLSRLTTCSRSSPNVHPPAEHCPRPKAPAAKKANSFWTCALPGSAPPCGKPSNSSSNQRQDTDLR